jgi:NTP pyrophosphatase (non-canonical NTP hydrolase)
MHDIVIWADSVMPKRQPADAIKKLSMEEVPELWRELKETGELSADELADIGIIWLDLCYMAGVDPLEVMEAKMQVNRQRTWKIEYGVLQHEDQ